MTSFGIRVPPDRTLHVQADLVLDIDGRAATITGSGQRLLMRLDDPGHTLRSMRGLASSSSLGEVADGLSAAGLRLDVDTTHGRLLSLGTGVTSPIGRFGTGSAAVAAGSPRALAFLAGQLVRRAVTRRRLLVAVGAAVSAMASAAAFGRLRARSTTN